MGVHMSRDEPIWTANSAATGIFEVVGDAFYQCMTVNVLGAVADVFCVGIRKAKTGDSGTARFDR